MFTDTRIRLYRTITNIEMTKTALPGFIGKKVVNIPGHGDMTINKGVKLMQKLLAKSNDPKLSLEQATILKRQAGEINMKLHNTTKSLMETVESKSTGYVKPRSIADNTYTGNAQHVSELNASDRYIAEQERLKRMEILNKPHTPVIGSGSGKVGGSNFDPSHKKTITTGTTNARSKYDIREGETLAEAKARIKGSTTKADIPIQPFDPSHKKTITTGTTNARSKYDIREGETLAEAKARIKGSAPKADTPVQPTEAKNEAKSVIQEATGDYSAHPTNTNHSTADAPKKRYGKYIIGGTGAAGLGAGAYLYNRNKD